MLKVHKTIKITLAVILVVILFLAILFANFIFKLLIFSYNLKWEYQVENIDQNYKYFESLSQIADKNIDYDDEYYFLFVNGDSLYNPNTHEDVVLTDQEKDIVSNASNSFENGDSHLELVYAYGEYTVFTSETKRYCLIYSINDKNPEHIFYYGKHNFETKKIKPQWYHALKE